MTDTYNGWSSRESWLVGLWLTSSDEATYQHWRERAQSARQAAPDTDQVQDGIWTPEQAARIGLSEEIKDALEEAAQDALNGAPMLADLLGAALARVDWDEVAEHLLEE